MMASDLISWKLKVWPVREWRNFLRMDNLNPFGNHNHCDIVYNSGFFFHNSVEINGQSPLVWRCLYRVHYFVWLWNQNAFHWNYSAIFNSLSEFFFFKKKLFSFHAWELDNNSKAQWWRKCVHPPIQICKELNHQNIENDTLFYKRKKNESYKVRNVRNHRPQSQAFESLEILSFSLRRKSVLWEFWCMLRLLWQRTLLFSFPQPQIPLEWLEVEEI